MGCETSRCRAVSMVRRAIRLRGLLAASFVLLPMGVQATMVTPDEMAEARRCVAALFDGVVAPNELRPGLEVVANYDLVQKNARFGKPFKIDPRGCVGAGLAPQSVCREAGSPPPRPPPSQ